MTTNTKKYNKARKHLINARESLEFWHEAYVENERNKCETLDCKLNYFDGNTIREERRKDILNCIKDAKERIAKFERIVY